MTKGVLYGIGIGPGDPELITLKVLEYLLDASTCSCRMRLLR